MKHLKINDNAPSFSALDENGNEINSKQFEGKKWVIYFYPKDLTPSCTVQACNIRDNYATLLKENISIVGVSMDNEKSHKRFIERHTLPFPLICDEDKKVIESFGVWGEKKFMGRIYDGIHRTTFIMNEKNKIIGIIEKPKTKDHVREILDVYNLK
ncbi:MAG: thioredoxin-dependent thiol peroxidase [Bacteroidota bacterium]